MKKVEELALMKFDLGYRVLYFASQLDSQEKWDIV